MDLERAFDTVSHPQLLEALKDSHSWHYTRTLKESDKEHIKDENELGTSRTIKFGMPQGTVSGTFIFNLSKKSFNY